MLALIPKLILLLVLVFIPGHLLLRALHIPRDPRPGGDIPTAVGLSIVLMALIHFTAFLIPGAPGIFVIVFTLVLCFVGMFRTPDPYKRLRVFLEPPVFLFLGFLGVMTLILMWTPSYNTAYTGNWGIYYPSVLVYLEELNTKMVGQEGFFGVFAKRTPFYLLANAFNLSWIGPSTYADYQLSSLVLNGSIFWGILALARRWGNKRVVILTLGALPLLPLLVRYVQIPTPKPMAAFFLFLAIDRYLDVRGESGPKPRMGSRWLFAIFSIAAYMTHPSMLFYLLGLGIDQLYLKIRKNRPMQVRLLVPLAGAFLLLAMPWYTFMYKTFGSQIFDPLPTFTKNVDDSFGGYLTSRIRMLSTTVLLPQPLYNAAFAPQSSENTFIKRWGRPLLRFFWETFLGGLTLSGFLFLCVGYWKGRRDTSDDPSPIPAVMTWMVLGAVLCLMVHLYRSYLGHAGNLMLPLVVMIWIVGCQFLARLQPIFFMMLMGLMVLESILIVLLAHQTALVFSSPFDMLYIDWNEQPLHGYATLAVLLIGTVFAYVLAFRPTPPPPTPAN